MLDYSKEDEMSENARLGLVKTWRKHADINDFIPIKDRHQGYVNALWYIDFLLSHIEEIERDTARRCVEIMLQSSLSTSPFDKSLERIRKEFNLGGE